MMLSFTVPAGPDRKAYNILRRELKASAALVRRLKQANAIFVDGQPAFTDRMLQPGQTLTADLDACEPPSDLIRESGPLTVLYEEEGFLAVHKPAGCLIHPTHARNSGTLCNLAAGYLQARGQLPVVHAVNRLDRDTEGVVLLAKNSHFHALLSDALSAKDAGKEYLALVCGTMPQTDCCIDLPIRRVNELDMKREVSPDGQRAVTHCRVLASDSRLSLLGLRLETGRTHQIRVHCAHLGCPLLGDKLYGTPASLTLSDELGITTQQLLAARLRFTHPLTGAPMEIFCGPARPEFARLAEELLGRPLSAAELPDLP